MNSIQKIESLPEQIWQEGMQFLGDFLEFQSAFILWMIIPGLFEPPVRTLRATIPENESHIFR